MVGLPPGSPGPRIIAPHPSTTQYVVEDGGAILRFKNNSREGLQFPLAAARCRRCRRRRCCRRTRRRDGQATAKAASAAAAATAARRRRRRRRRLHVLLMHCYSASRAYCNVRDLCALSGAETPCPLRVGIAALCCTPQSCLVLNQPMSKDLGSAFRTAGDPSGTAASPYDTYVLPEA